VEGVLDYSAPLGGVAGRKGIHPLFKVCALPSCCTYFALFTAVPLLLLIIYLYLYFSGFFNRF
jgi:hypothetical protein